MTKVTSLKENQQVYVLHTYPFKETSLIVEIFSKELHEIVDKKILTLVRDEILFNTFIT